MSTPKHHENDTHTRHMLPGSVVILKHGCLEAELHPALGARLTSLRRQSAGGTFDYLVPIDAAHFDLSRWQRAGCFPMLPFTNKFPRNTLVWRDETIRVAAPDAPAWFHGWGMRSRWEVVEASPVHCTMALTAAAMESWPWTYRAELRVGLDSDGLSMSLEVLNISASPMPLGVGFHPYFSIAGDMEASLITTGRWQASATSEGLPSVREALDKPLRLNLRDSALPEDTLTWFCESASGRAVIDYPQAGRRITLTSNEARYLVLHYRAGERFLCIEPSTHLAGTLDPSDHIARPETPVRLDMRLQLE